jgi:ribonuclease R
MNTKIEHKSVLQDIAKRAMLERGLLPEFPPEVLVEVDRIKGPAENGSQGIHDQRDLLWSSIDNDDSLDLDQLTVAEEMSDDRIKIFIGIADVDALVPRGSAMDRHAQHNTTSVYTPARVFSMLPEKLSTDFTSLNVNEDRLVIVVEMVVNPDGSLGDTDIYRALVCNHLRLSYNSTAAWLDGSQEDPEGITRVKGMGENLRLQDRAAQRLQRLRQKLGALSFETIEARPVFEGERIHALKVERKNRAKELIQDFMIAANGVTARYLSERKYPSIRRVVEQPKRWDRIVGIAQEYGYTLPQEPDSLALEAFLNKQKAEDPGRFPDLSLSVIKMMGSGEYRAEPYDDMEPDHFGLAVEDYTHSTAPNRRYTDLITHRLLKAAFEGKPSAYSLPELTALAARCTEQENEANKIERQVRKSAAALLYGQRIGDKFDAFVTGASSKGTWVRLVKLPVEGKLVKGWQGLDVGDRVRVELTGTNVERGFIDFKKVGN